MSQNKNTIQHKLDTLDKIVKQFESTDSKLEIDKALKDYEEAMKLVSEIRKELNGVELKINEIQEKYAEEEN